MSELYDDLSDLSDDDLALVVELLEDDAQDPDLASSQRTEVKRCLVEARRIEQERRTIELSKRANRC